ncbi:MAG: tRNA (adenosine(37)-N6)-threonylcarbamoyltransferase complex dimerization subunit type 1 TsaB [Bacteroidales bacterium]|nr:tRNA (adenosine(37)-N6)-threonylcarbamoyltransferase complex dimerization subunit type 1 TsaB [Bacteroidales bacterium]
MITEPLLLHIETATEVCSVALSKGATILGVEESADGHSHSKNLLPFIEQLMQATGKSLEELDGIVVSIGPGSYTGLRIGTSTAKGIAYSLGKPVITVGTLESIARGTAEAWASDGLQAPQYVSMIDARRMEVFAAHYDENLCEVGAPAPVIVDEEAFRTLLDEHRIVFCGNGMPKCKELLSKHPNALFIDKPLSARSLLQPALKKWEAQEFADTAYFEPFYLKEYVAAKPVVKGLHPNP